MSNEAFVAAWQKNPFNSACLVLDGWPLPDQPWQLDFEQGLYAETYHALLKSSGMYPNNWSNEISAHQFVGGSMLLSWDLTPDDSDRVAYLSPRRLGMKASLRFTRPLPATTTLIAYAQYNNLVVIDTYRMETIDYNTWCLAGNFWKPSAESPRGLGRWSVSTPGMNTGPARVVPGCLPDQHGSQQGCWGTLCLGFVSLSALILTPHGK